MDEERWAHCHDTDAYDISTNGRIKNNKTGKELKIPAKTVPAFSAGKKFKTVVNGK